MDVAERVDELVARHDPATTGATTFRGAQWYAGLAGVLGLPGERRTDEDRPRNEVPRI